MWTRRMPCGRIAASLRWGELLYDLSARALQGADNPFQTDAAVWWQDYVTCRDLPDQRRQYIVSLVQPPAAKHVNECFPPLETLANLVLNFQPPPGQRATGAWALEPEPQPCAVRVPLAGEGPIRLVVPRLKYWTVVVVETTAGAVRSRRNPPVHQCLASGPRPIPNRFFSREASHDERAFGHGCDGNPAGWCSTSGR